MIFGSFVIFNFDCISNISLFKQRDEIEERSVSVFCSNIVQFDTFVAVKMKFFLLLILVSSELNVDLLLSFS